ncbi:hypothetical protein [Dysgonomonas sp. 520]|uniref:hypothetical protein n=1 Tax=Dysgonomonas sp. 520 TaxID=2302931 RepID=UPI0013D69749|nr:hypothetical protein [Dysgonomonas sp. 520]NDW11263.1 hypothetical protein [Dysgonomonas sp. 520]
MKSVILEYAIERKGEIETIYQYDFSESLNVINVKNQKIAFIDSSQEDITLLTKTKVMSESDDNNNVLELQTKTRANQELIKNETMNVIFFWL